MCGSAKLYESYICLNNRRKMELNMTMKGTVEKAHNPLMDAYYTLYVFVHFNLYA